MNKAFTPQPDRHYISATVQWSVSESSRPATRYIISCSNGYYSDMLNGSENSLTLQNLLPYTQYNCSISGIDCNGVVGPRVSTSFQTSSGGK